MTKAAARLRILGAALLFSTGGAAIKSAAFTAWQIASFRSGIAALAVWLLTPEARRGWSARTLLVGLAYAATLTLFVLANRLTTAANTIFLQSTAPLYLLLLGPFVLHERISREDLLYMAALGVGLGMFFVGREESFATAPDPFRGNVLAALSGLCWALTVAGLRWLGKRGDSGAAAVVAGNLIAFAIGLPLALPVGAHAAADWAVIIYLGVFQIALAYVLLTRALSVVPAFEASLLLYLEPALNPIWAWLVHGERPGQFAFLGGAIILLATGVKGWWDGRAKRVLSTERV
jgi:drug/metabolite transporter (DMT)-like permease